MIWDPVSLGPLRRRPVMFDHNPLRWTKVASQILRVQSSTVREDEMFDL